MFHEFLMGRYLVHLLIVLGVGAVVIDICFWLWEKYRWDFPAVAGVILLFMDVLVFAINPVMKKEYLISYALWAIGSLAIFIPSIENGDREALRKLL
jgi:uncharacterized membrane protein